jgi:two-component system, NtrC family, sensor histidine kinase HydH
MTPRLQSGRLGRWGLLGTTFAMAAALLVTSWLGLREAKEATTALDRGQGELLTSGLRRTLRDRGGPPGTTLMDSLLTQHEASGARYIAFYDSDRRLIASAGTSIRPTPDSTMLEARGGGARDLVTLSAGATARLQAATYLPPTVVADSTGRLTWERFNPDRVDQGPRPRPSIVMVEFEPSFARHLVTQAERSMIVSAIVAAALFGASLLFWWVSVKHDLAQRVVEQQRRLGMLGEMSAVLAHEIRNPLASLKGHAQLLAERLPDQAPERRKADRIVQEAVRLEALTSDLLDFARTGPIERQEVDPAALLAAAAEEVAPDGFAMVGTAAPATWSVDAKRLRQVLTNVLRNARQVTAEGTRPEATITRDGSSLVFAVRDFGPGLSAGDRARIFVPFYTTRTTGTGLGLTVAKRIAELHGGTITADNHPDGGAVFRIVIPRS